MKKCFLKRFALVLLILVQCVSLIGCNVKEDKSFQSMEDFESAVIGVLTGSSFDLLEMLVTIEYSEEHDDADVVVRFSGDAFDPRQTDNELSMLLVKKAADSIAYSFDHGLELGNRVDAKIR